MKQLSLFLFAIVLLAAGCGGNSDADNGVDPLKQRAKVAEKNLRQLRDAVVKYHEKNGEAPQSVSDLNGFGGAEADLETNDDYSELGFSFYSLEFEDGKLTQGWFMATPMADTGALQVRMNGVTGEFDYMPQGEDFAPAETDED